MKKLVILISMVFSVWLSVANPENVRAQNTTPTPPAPPGFRLIDSGYGVYLFRKDYANGSPDFVQVVDMGIGAQVRLLHGMITEPRPTKGSFGGPDPRMTSPTIQNHWNMASAQAGPPFCVVNGSFFYMPEYPTRLAFPLKVDGQLVTEGWGINTYIDQKLLLELWPDRADIRDLTQDNLYNSDAPNILGGLAEDANKRAKYSVGRTFVGIEDQDDDGSYETLLILSTRTAKQTGAAGVLRDFGADKVMMLDGGGSTQLLCASGHYVQSDRPIPQALAVFAADLPPIAAELIRSPGWTVLVDGERLPFEFEVRNTGSLGWTTQETRFYIDPGPTGGVEWLPVHGEIIPGASVVLSDSLKVPSMIGTQVISITWGIRSGGENYKGGETTAAVVILPKDLAARRQEFTAEIQGWGDLPQSEFQARVNQWIESSKPTAMPTVLTGQVQTQPAAKARFEDILWIPLLVLPIALLLVYFTKIKHNSYN